MIGCPKRYREVSRTVAAWLEHVPNHWEVLPGRSCFREKRRLNVGLRDTTVLSLSYGRIVIRPPESLHGLVPESYETYQTIDPSDIVIRPTDLQNDHTSLRIGFSSHRGIITSAYLCFVTTDRMTPRFGYLVLHAYDLIKVIYGLGSGLRQNLDWADFKNLPFPIPPLSEQAAIARFVDDVDRRVQRYIRGKEKLIGLLEEYKQAVVHQVVTGQIDVRTGKRYPTYKDSGADWTDGLPLHWEVSTLTRIAAEVSDYRGATPTKTETGVFLVTAKNIRRGWIDYETSREFVAEDEYGAIMRRGLPRIGDLLLTTEAPLGHAALVDREHVAFAQRVIRFRFDQQLLLPEYALRSVLAPYFQDQLLRRGTGSTALGIKASKLPQLKIALPPLVEQRAILAHLAAVLDPSDAEQDLASRQIGLAREYRARLVADVVTGKLDVREEAAGLPDVEALDDANDLTTEFTTGAQA